MQFRANRRQAHLSHVKHFIFAFLHSSEKRIRAEIGVADVGRCSTNFCMYGYKVFECATKYGGVMGITVLFKRAPPRPFRP